MNLNSEQIREYADIGQIHYWIRRVLELNGTDPSKKYLLILDIIGVTSKLHCMREIPEQFPAEVIAMLNREVIQILNYSLRVAGGLKEILQECNFEYAGDKGDRIDIIGDSASIIMLSLILKTSQLGKDLRMLVLGEESDWKYREENIRGRRVPNLILNHQNLDLMPTKDVLSSTNSILFSPSLQHIVPLLNEMNLVNELAVPNPVLSQFLVTMHGLSENVPARMEIAKATTLIVRAGDNKEAVSQQLLEGLEPEDILVNLDSGRKNLSWITLKGNPLSILTDNAIATLKQYPHSQIFYTSNLTLFATLVNNETLCLDPYATNILSKLLRMHTFQPGVHIFNPKAETAGFKKRIIENHVGTEERFDYYGLEEM